MTPEEYNEAAEQLQRDLAGAGTLVDFKVASYLQNRFRFPPLADDSEARELGWSGDEFYVRFSVKVGGRRLIGFTLVPSHLVADNQSCILHTVALYIANAVIYPDCSDTVITEEAQ